MSLSLAWGSWHTCFSMEVLVLLSIDLSAGARSYKASVTTVFLHLQTLPWKSLYQNKWDVSHAFRGKKLGKKLGKNRDMDTAFLHMLPHRCDGLQSTKRCFDVYLSSSYYQKPRILSSWPCAFKITTLLSQFSRACSQRMSEWICPSRFGEPRKVKGSRWFQNKGVNETCRLRLHSFKENARKAM